MRLLILLTPSEEVTKTWIKRKGILIKSRPEPSRFSFVVCLAIVLSIAFGFLGGFVTAGLALSENYSSVYESLLAELDNTRRCLDREKEQLLSIKNHQHDKDSDLNSGTYQAYRRPGAQVPEQAILTIYNQAIKSFEQNDITGGCAELKSILKNDQSNKYWKNKASILLDKNCQ